MVYHSSFVDLRDVEVVCGCPLLPLKHAKNRSAAAAKPETAADIVDEAIALFRANVLFRRFDVRGPADKLLVYLTLYINMALRRIEACGSEAEGIKALINLGLERFPIPGEPGFPLGGLLDAPQTKMEAEALRNYLKQAREETSGRLLENVYTVEGKANKWWLAFGKRKFMNIALPL